MKNKKDFVERAMEKFSNEKQKEIKKSVEKEIFKIKLSQLRENMGLKQEDLIHFTQSNVSRLENRQDMKISTIIDYLEDLGLGFEIKVYSKNKNDKKEVILIHS
jgi:hypothetical protein